MRHDFAGRDADGWIGHLFVVAPDNFIAQPFFDSCVTSLERAETVTDHFAFGRVLAGSDLGFDHRCHVMRQGDADRVRISHGQISLAEQSDPLYD